MKGFYTGDSMLFCNFRTLAWRKNGLISARAATSRQREFSSAGPECSRRRAINIFAHARCSRTRGSNYFCARASLAAIRVSGHAWATATATPLFKRGDPLCPCVLARFDQWLSACVWHALRQHYKSSYHTLHTWGANLRAQGQAGFCSRRSVN